MPKPLPIYVLGTKPGYPQTVGALGTVGPRKPIGPLPAAPKNVQAVLDADRNLRTALDGNGARDQLIGELLAKGFTDIRFYSTRIQPAVEKLPGSGWIGTPESEGTTTTLVARKGQGASQFFEYFHRWL
jgi:hypothetical protein